jgi:protoporphyrin/coproporphyrin ferrochelatase
MENDPVPTVPAMTQPYDAILVVSFGGPEGIEDVMPFLENVLRGRNVPAERLREVAQHYELFDGVSPINEQNRELIAELKAELTINGPNLPIYWGNRNWHPMLADTFRQMKDDGVQNALAFFTSAYSSYSGCRQYLENIERAREEVGPGAPVIEKLRAYYNHPGFIEPNIENLSIALGQLPAESRSKAQIAFTAHSIPVSMSVNCDYHDQLLEACRLVADGAGHSNWRLVFQSRSGSPAQPWLEPDICDHLSELSESGVTDVVVAPIGFVSDHMEVIYDLDTEAWQHSKLIGINMIRAATVGTHPKFVSMIRELIVEKTNPETTRRFVGTRGPSHDVCRTDCCRFDLR